MSGIRGEMGIIGDTSVKGVIRQGADEWGTVVYHYGDDDNANGR